MRLPKLASKLKVVNLGVEAGDLDKNVPPFASRENAFMMVGHVKERKGTLEAVEALKMVCETYPDAKLYIIGPTSDREEYAEKVKRRAAALGLGSNVIWCGRISDTEVNAYYRKVKGLVMPSKNTGYNFEGFGLVHLEANTFGVPAIGSRNCGNEDAVKDGFSGFLVEQGDIAGLAEKMKRLLGDETAWNQLSLNAFDFAYSMRWEVVVENYLRVYRELIA